MGHSSQLVIGALCALLVVTAAAQDRRREFFADHLVQAKQEKDAAKAKARMASEYDGGYTEVDLSCLQQQNFKNCRYTGCTKSFEDCGDNCDECIPDSIVFQTDFSCCAKEHSYGYEQHHGIGYLGFSDKIGTCDWEISMYKWTWDPSGSSCDNCWTPYLTDDGSALKFGTVWGTCYLNSEADHCDHPLCERMAISIQGGLYASCAYSESDSNYGPAALEETCRDNGIPFNGIYGGSNAERVGRNGRRNTTGNTGTATIMQEDTHFGFDNDNFFTDGAIQEWAQYIYVYAEALLKDRCSGSSNTQKRSTGRTAPPAGLAPPAAGSKVSAADAKVNVASGGSYEHEHLHAGMAIVVSGPFYETSKHDNKIQETGLFEWAPYWRYYEDAGEAVNRWPIVHGGGAKLRFTREKEEQQYASRK